MTRFLMPILLFLLLIWSSDQRDPQLSLAEIKSLAPFEAVVESVEVRPVSCCSGMDDYTLLTLRLCTADGRKISVTETQTKLVELGFARSLKPGRTYAWPKAIFQYEQDLQRRRTALKQAMK